MRKIYLLLIIYFIFCNYINSQVVLNEVMVNPNSQGLVNAGQEYVEIYNPNPCAPADISGYILGSRVLVTMQGGGQDYGGAFVIPAGTVLQPLGFLVLGTQYSSADPASIDIKIPGYDGTGNLCDPFTSGWLMANTAGWIELYDAKGIPVDGIYWTFSPGSGGEINTDGDSFGSQPCVPAAAGNNGVTQLLSAKQIYKNYPSNITYAGENPGKGLTYSRMPDGQSWQRNVAPSINDATRDAAGKPRNFNDLNNLPNLTTLFSWSFSKTVPTCGATNGTIIVTVTKNGNPPFTYSKDNGATTQGTGSFTNLPSGSYHILVKDSKGCQRDTIIDLSSSNAPQITSITPVTAYCGQSNGSVTVNATSGTTPYTYKWSTTPQQTGQTANNIPAGNYTVTVTDSKGCSVTGNTTVPDTPGPTANAVSATDKCGQGIGSATATGSGGTGGFTYKWNTNPVQTTQTATNLKAGNYTVTITDSKNCSAAASTTVGDTPGPTASAVSVADTCTLGVGTATANPSGGTGPYTYKWSTTPQQTTQKATGLKSGNYTVTVSDNNSCTAIAQVTVNNIGGPTVSITYTDARCTNDNGTASVTASGGNPPYTYVWSNGANTSSISNLSADTYTVSVYDKGSCPPFTGTAVIKNIAPPVITKMEVTDATCGNNNGAINVTISAGTSPFTYKWSSGQTTQNLTNLAAGDYTITVTDKTPCSTNGTATVKSVGGPQLTTAKTDENCGKKDGTATVTATGGTGNFTYLWNTVPPQTTATASNLSAGTYRVTVSDGGPCPAIATVQIINIPGPMATVNVTDAHCFQSDGSASLNVTGGSGNYTYSWNTNPPNSTSEISAVPPGIYVVTVSDGKCTLILSADIKNISGPKANFTYSPSIVSSSNPVCQFTDQSTGSPVKWHWDFGDGTEPSGEQNPNHRYSSTDTFYVKLVVANQFNCKDSIVRIVWVKEDFKVYIPDAFTPNNDHLNDVFGIKGQAIDTRNYEMRIYDRWGNQIFYSNNINIKWDGSFNNKLVPQDTYTYRILVGELGGPTHTYLGSVMVIR